LSITTYPLPLAVGLPAGLRAVIPGRPVRAASGASLTLPGGQEGGPEAGQAASPLAPAATTWPAAPAPTPVTPATGCRRVALAVKQAAAGPKPPALKIKLHEGPAVWVRVEFPALDLLPAAGGGAGADDPDPYALIATLPQERLALMTV
jgi:hypothetical protein